MSKEKEYTLKLLSHEIQVVIEDPGDWAEGSMGRANLMQQKVHINSSMPKDARDSTLIHELVHLISDMNSLELTEIHVDVISTGFFSFLRDNSELVYSLLEPEK